MSSHSSDNSSTSSQSNQQNDLWEHGDDDFLSSNSSGSFINLGTFSSSTVPTPSSSQPPTPGLAIPMTSLELNSQESQVFFPISSTITAPRKRMGRHWKKYRFRGNQYNKIQPPSSSLDDSTILDTSTQSIPQSKRYRYKVPRCGYTSRFSAPFPDRKYRVIMKRDPDTTRTVKASKPHGMRILDIGILAEAMTKIRCIYCSNDYLSLYESDFVHGWQTDFYIKCASCHHLYAEFPSSKPMNLSESTKFVNTTLPKQGLNEVTMRSVLAVHCSGLSWRDLHKFATVFEMPRPLEHTVCYIIIRNYGLVYHAIGFTFEQY